MAPSNQVQWGPDGIARRAVQALPTPSYSRAFWKAKDKLWSPEDPDGNIIIMIAENRLITDMLHEKVLEVQGKTPVSAFYYPLGFKGFPAARQAMARMMQRTFMKGVDVQPDNVAILAGAGAVLELLFWCIVEPGVADGVLLPAPIYPGFLKDMKVKANGHTVLFDLNESVDVRQQLSAAAAAAEADGHPVRALLLAHPNNPLGIVYKRSTVRDILLWCLDNHVHFISDEIYALSVWGDSAEAAEFESAEVIARQELAEGNLTPAQVELLPNYLHIVYGLSKDFGSSGLRVGVLHTHNASIMACIANTAYFHCCSTPTLWALTEVLSDDDFIDRFIAENKRRMAAAYKGLEDALVQHEIPHVRACAAMFCWIDLRKGLLQPSWEGERELWEALNSVGVLMTPGEACKASEPGFFRMCWAWAPAAALPVAVQRIAKLLATRQQQKHLVQAVN